jgi:hypothetical protein
MWEVIMNFSLDSMLGAFGIYVLVISALAFGVERIMDLTKAFAKKHLIAEPLQKGLSAEENKENLKKETNRQRRVRIWAIFYGLILAFLCKVDTFQLLGINSPYWHGYPVLGCVLSGLAASNGSSFFHDMIGIVTAFKETKAAVVDAQKRGQTEPIG